MQYGERFHGFNSKEKSHSSSLHLLMVYTCVIQYMGQVPNLSSNYGFTQVLEICSEKESLTTVYICSDMTPETITKRKHRNYSKVQLNLVN
ncbi:hypothetical protein HanRHA438_Chr12g0551051 [Helianthus annuus]|nr:hypothetical protein HanRHA438_Chr12g0551051 [Helianthus annuus]